MLYDNIYVLSEICYRFLLDNPDIQQDGAAADAGVDLSRELEEWLECETSVTDLSHKSRFLQLAASYEAVVELRDTLTATTEL